MPIPKPNYRRRRMIAAVTLTVAGGIGLRWMDADRLDPAPPPYVSPRQVSLTQDGPNAAHFYAAAADSLTPDALIAGNLMEASLDERRRVVRDNAESLRFLRQGFAYRFEGGKTRWLTHPAHPDPFGPAVSFVTIRQMTRLLGAEASVKAAEGQSGAAMDAALDAIRFGQDIGGEPDSFIGVMIGQLLVGIGADAAETGGKDGGSLVPRLSASEARASARRLEDLLRHSPTAAAGLQAEKLLTHAQLRESLRPLQPFRPAVGMFDSPGDNKTHLTTVYAVFRYGKQGTLQTYDQYMSAAIRRASLPYAVARNAAPPPVSPNPLVALSVPNTERAQWQFARNGARLRLLLTELALRAYRAEHGGASPEVLASLTKGPNPYLTSVPTDPFSPDGAGRLRYRNGVVSSVAKSLERL